MEQNFEDELIVVDDQEQTGEDDPSYNKYFGVKDFKRYFDYFDDGDAKKALCRKCGISTTRPNSATTGMEHHLKKCNNTAWEAMKALRSATKPRTSGGQLPLKWDDSDQRSVEMDKNWLKVICLNLHPLSFTEQKGLDLICHSK